MAAKRSDTGCWKSSNLKIIFLDWMDQSLGCALWDSAKEKAIGFVCDISIHFHIFPASPNTSFLHSSLTCDGCGDLALLLVWEDPNCDGSENHMWRLLPMDLELKHSQFLDITVRSRRPMAEYARLCVWIWSQIHHDCLSLQFFLDPELQLAAARRYLNPKRGPTFLEVYWNMKYIRYI